jgi:hypothetical protein
VIQTPLHSSAHRTRARISIVPMTTVHAAIVILATATSACSADHVAGPAATPVITAATLAANPHSVLSTIITFTATNGDSARVVSLGATDTPEPSPYIPVTSGGGRIVTLGLLPTTAYAQVLQVVGRGGRIATDTMHVTTAALPPYVAGASLAVAGTPTGRYTLVSPIFTPDTGIIIVFDSAGRVRWYRTFPGLIATESKQQPLNGDFTVALAPPGASGFEGSLLGAASGTFVEVDPAGDSVAAWVAPDSLGLDVHELWLTAGASGEVNASFFEYEGRPGDLSSVGGPASTTVYGHHLTRQDATGATLFDWNAWDHYGVADWIEPTGVNPPLDFDHANAMTFDLDSNYVASFRAMGAIVKIDRTTGAILWQLGGRLNQYTITGDPLTVFGGQHCVRILPNGHVLMFDNGLNHSPRHSRAVEYALDESSLTAQMVWEYLPPAPIFSAIVGSVQRLLNGNTVVEFGTSGLIDEVTPTGTLLSRSAFTFHGNPNAYRALRLGSLYHYIQP